MIHPKHTDEPSIRPATPAAALWRLSHLVGALERETSWNAMPILHEKLARALTDLLNVAASNGNSQDAFENSQAAIREVYDAATSAQKTERLVRLGFPDPLIEAKDYVGPVDISTVVVSHFKPLKQVFSTISFEEAHGATAYWLLEIRVLGDGSEAFDAIVENYAPYFSRVRLPIGRHRFVIESRNPSKHARTREFEVEVPEL